MSSCPEPVKVQWPEPGFQEDNRDGLSVCVAGRTFQCGGSLGEDSITTKCHGTCRRADSLSTDNARTEEASASVPQQGKAHLTPHADCRRRTSWT
ncbi:uncharacterized protein [Macaca nemestrina]|uniref:uncharacterized protein isoform X2 n=1 Tax=Macaca nemestrina TaxID=9545 RepID=UPI0039B89808